MSETRLDKLLARSGAGTRSEVKKIIRAGRVTVNGHVLRQPELKADPGRDEICLDGKRLRMEETVVLMLHKPAGCVTATRDDRQKTVMDYIDHERKRELFPAGRLDLDTEGLLLVTNDGALAHRMLSPKHHVEKTYFVTVRGRVTEEDGNAFREGVDIGDPKKTLPAALRIVTRGEISQAELTICEGRFHQVKRMFGARGMEVLYLKRISMAGIRLDEGLRPGEWRPLSEEEKERLETICWNR